MLSRDEVRRVLSAMSGTFALMARLMYGTGLRVMECLQLRVKDVEFDRHSILVRDGKGRKIGLSCYLVRSPNRSSNI